MKSVHSCADNREYGHIVIFHKTVELYLNEKHAHKRVVQLCTIMFKSEQSVSSAKHKLTKAETVVFELYSEWFVSLICSFT